MGDVKNVANGYARNFLFPHMYAVPYNDQTVAYFESRKEEIEARKEQKRKDAASLKDKLEALTIELKMPAAANGKLFGEAAFAEHHRAAPDGRRRLADRLPGLLSGAHGQHRGISRHTDALHEARLSNVPILP